MTGPKHGGEVRIAVDRDNKEIPLGKIGVSASARISMRPCRRSATPSPPAVCIDYKPGAAFQPDDDQDPAGRQAAAGAVAERTPTTVNCSSER